MVILLCLTGAFFCLLFFWRNLNQTVSQQNAQPVGTISWKHKVTQRRFQDRVLWARLQQDAPVYYGDFIRTDVLSETTITLSKGSRVNLAESSLIQIFSENEVPLLTLSRGDISINAAEGAGTAMLLDAEGNLITIAGGTVLDARVNSEGNFDLAVSEGSASLVIGGEIKSIDAGGALTLDSGGRALEAPRTVMLSPKPVTRIIQTVNSPAPVDFTWNGVHYAEGDTTRIEIAADRGFKRIIRTLAGGEQTRVRTELAPGAYFWRAYPVSVDGADGFDGAANASTGSLTISYVPESQLLNPPPGYEYRYRSRPPAVTFQWTASPEVSSYTLEVADNAGFANPVVQTPVQGGAASALSFVHPGLEKGRWYWRVVPENLAPAAPASFTITQTGSLAAPTLLRPPAESPINIAEAGSDIYFSWKSETEAASYTLLVSALPGLQDPVFTRQLTANYYTYAVKENLLREGWYYWGVYQTDAEGISSALSSSWSISVTTGESVLRPLFPLRNYLVTGNRLPDFTWETNLTKPLHFQVSDTPDFSRLALDVPVEGGVFRGGTLGEGWWYWRVAALDGSVQTPGRSFQVVLPPPVVAAPPPPPVTPLGAATLLLPENGYRIGAEQLRESEFITFTWGAVPGANAYGLALYQEAEGKRQLIRRWESSAQTSRNIEVSLLGNGSFIWQVEARKLAADGSIERRGTAVENHFALDLPAIQRKTARNPGTVYGQ
ncbi:hypothetical protein AGMMS49942_09530 [Spirochaetia bacterium]|nr:hypothetical protein AGMMS49942_09530 [Spirochaetia bacterium]